MFHLFILWWENLSSPNNKLRVSPIFLETFPFIPSVTSQRTLRFAPLWAPPGRRAEKASPHATEQVDGLTGRNLGGATGRKW